MGHRIALAAKDGTSIGAWEATPPGLIKGHVVVIQEIFGVNNHIRNVVDRLAADGYRAVAPCFFDRLEPGVELTYTPEGIARGRELVTRLATDRPLADMEAAIAYLRGSGAPRVGITGFCWGGTMTWLAAARLHVDCAVGYYGGGIYANRGLAPRCPTMLHFGDKDAHIPPEHVEAIRDAHPEVVVHVYAADHGFHCDERASYDADAARQAYARTLAFFAEHLR